MRVLLAPFGTRGDVQPMLALAHGLKAAGHDAVFCAPPNYGAWIEAHGFVFHGAGLDYGTVLRELTASKARAFAVLAAEVPAQFAALAPLVDEADVVISASLEYATSSLAERAGKPRRLVVYSPSMLPSPSYPMTLVPVYGMPRWLNALTWSVGELALRMTTMRAVNHERKRLRMRPVGHALSHQAGAGFLLPFDDALERAPADLPVPVLQTGAWLLEEKDDLPADVEDFLAAGPPPVYLGFGSMLDADPAKTARVFAEAIRASGVRALVAGAPDDVVRAAGDVHFIGALPHRKLFPRCLGVVHHGGAGTFLATALSGVPQVIVPHEVDQFFHGRLCHQRGLGPEAVKRTRLSSSSLTSALRALAEGGYHDACRRLAARMARDGVERAVRALEALQREEPSAERRDRMVS